MKKNSKIILLTAIALVVVIGIYFGVYAIFAVGTGVKISINEDVTYQTASGFGASSCWTFQKLGAASEETIDDVAELLYGDSGLKLNIFRYNIGAGSLDDVFDDKYPYNTEGYDILRRSQSFFDADKFVNMDSFSDPTNYDFTRDAYTMKVFDACLKLGNINTVVLFANSPHYLMTENGLATGDYNYQNNLREDAFEAFCDYLIIISDYFREKLSLLSKPIKLVISPVNEPQWKWGGEGSNGQEGCHYDADRVAKLYNVFMPKLDSYNKQNNCEVKAEFFESGNYIMSNRSAKVKDYFAQIAESEYFDENGSVAVHSYGANDSLSKKRGFAKFLEKNYPNLKISMTEYCEMVPGRDTSIDSGLLTGRVISRDLSILSATDWSWWLALSTGDYNDGLVYWDKTDTGDKLSMLKRYYVMGHYSKFIEQGDVRVDVKCSDFMNFASLDYCAYKKSNGNLVIVILNGGAANKIKFDISGYSSAKIITTTASDNWVETILNDTSKINLLEDSATTIIFEK